MEHIIFATWCIRCSSNIYTPFEKELVVCVRYYYYYYFIIIIIIIIIIITHLGKITLNIENAESIIYYLLQVNAKKNHPAK